MRYQISFGGVASSDLTQLLSAVESQLNVQVTGLQLLADVATQSDASPASTGGSAASGGEGKVIPNCICPDGKPPHGPNCICPDGKPPHGPNFYLFVGGVVGLVIGLLVGIAISRLATSKTVR